MATCSLQSVAACLCVFVGFFFNYLFAFLSFPIRWWSVRLHRSSTSLHAKMHHDARSCSPLRWWLQWCEQCKTQVTWRRPEQRPASCTTCPIRGRVCSPSSSLEESLLWFACSGTDLGNYFTSYPAVIRCSFSSILMTFCFFVTVDFKLDKVI